MRPAPWHALTAAETARILGLDQEVGLSSAEAAGRLRRIGPNLVRAVAPDPWWAEVLEALTEPLVLLLLGVGVAYAILGNMEDAITIFVVIVAVAAVEVVLEWRARRAVDALRDLAAPRASVLRSGMVRDVPPAELVRGDMVLLDPGSRVPADVRLTRATGLRIDESMLTGESLPSGKDPGVRIDPSVPLGDRVNLAYAGTVVVAGKGRGIVVDIGQSTELGRIAELAHAAPEPRTQLENYLRELAGWLLWLALGFSVLVPVLGVLIGGQGWREMLLTGLTLAFATIPEELPMLVTMVLGIGTWRLAGRHAIVKRLHAAEALGAVSVIATDKTGTLTENRMELSRLRFASPIDSGATQALELRLLEVAVLASDAMVTATGYSGDPTETALLRAADDAGLNVLALRSLVRTLREHGFDDERKRVSVVYERGDDTLLAMKGAPESVLGICRMVWATGGPEPLDDPKREELLRFVEEMAGDGERVLAVAESRERVSASEPVETVESDLTLVGFVGLLDPPRPEAAPAVADLQEAGIRLVMMTGDHASTAHAIADSVGIPAGRVVSGPELDAAGPAEFSRLAGEVDVFARITPEHKLRLVETLMSSGSIVAVTGDGINDAPALRRASVGVAMGKRGTDVAREAADVVLEDDNFATLSIAVHAGRVLYDNLWKAVRYYLGAKIALVVASLVPVLAGLPVPFLPVQIILLELFMDLGASTTFIVEPPEGDVMARPPRDSSRPFMDRSMIAGIVLGGLSLASAVLAAYFWAHMSGLGTQEARTAAFAAWLIGHVVLAAHMRSAREPLFRRGSALTGPFLIWVAAAFAAAVIAPLVPPVAHRLYLSPLPATTWIVTAAAALVLPSWWEVAKLAHWRTATGE